MPPGPVDDSNDDATLSPAEVASRARARVRTIDDALPAETRLGRYVLRGTIGQGGFAIVYRAWDQNLQREVAIKEYMPSAFATRSAGADVLVRSERHVELFAQGLESFVGEARMLAGYDHPALLKVFDFWEANGTAYMVMPYYRGGTLKQTVESGRVEVSEAWLSGLLQGAHGLLGALRILHGGRCYHRDIAPDNIMLLDDGQALLLDFGAARRVWAEESQALTVILKPGYAPIEQYDGRASTTGPWTDLYALGAVLYWAMLRKPPPPSVARLSDDTIVRLGERDELPFSRAFREGVDCALSVNPAVRPQSVEAFARLLGLGQVESVRHTATPTIIEDRSVRPGGRAGQVPAKAATLLAGFWVVAAISAGITGLITAGFVWWTASSRNVLAEKPPQPGADQAQTRPPAPAPDPPPAPPVPTPVPPTAREVADALYRQRAAGSEIGVQLSRREARIGIDEIAFSVRFSEAGYLYVVRIPADQGMYQLIFPNAERRDNRVVPGMAVNVPGSKTPMLVEGPAGESTYLVINSASPRSTPIGFVQSGLRRQLNAAEIGQFDREDAIRAIIGGVQCSPGATCPDRFGVARFSMAEVHAEAREVPQIPQREPPIVPVMPPKPPVAERPSAPKEPPRAPPRPVDPRVLQRCNNLIERAGVGEQLPPEEIRFLRSNCGSAQLSGAR